MKGDWWALSKLFNHLDDENNWTNTPYFWTERLHIVNMSCSQQSYTDSLISQSKVLTGFSGTQQTDSKTYMEEQKAKNNQDIPKEHKCERLTT